jgi:hypothetical protein
VLHRVQYGANGWVRLLLEPMQYIPAFDGALQQLIANIHEPTRHDIQGKECESRSRVGVVFGWLMGVTWGSSYWVEGIVWAATL